MMHTADYINLEKTYATHTYTPLDVVLSRGEGVWVWDVEGKKYLDCLSAYSALNQGHRHPRIIAAMMEQAERDVDFTRSTTTIPPGEGTVT